MCIGASLRSRVSSCIDQGLSKLTLSEEDAVASRYIGPLSPLRLLHAEGARRRKPWHGQLLQEQYLFVFVRGEGVGAHERAERLGLVPEKVSAMNAEDTAFQMPENVGGRFGGGEKPSVSAVESGRVRGERSCRGSIRPREIVGGDVEALPRVDVDRLGTDAGAYAIRKAQLCECPGRFQACSSVPGERRA